MHGLQEIIYANKEVTRKHKANALRNIVERIALCRLGVTRYENTKLKCSL
jgi:hypothetical protein